VVLGRAVEPSVDPMRGWRLADCDPVGAELAVLGPTRRPAG